MRMRSRMRLVLVVGACVLTLATAGSSAALSSGPTPGVSSLLASAVQSGCAAGSAHGGYWVAAADGGVFSYGGAPFYGSMAGRHLNAPIVGIVATPDGGGYWLVAKDGGIFAFGDAKYEGNPTGLHLAAPVVGAASAAAVTGCPGPQGPQGATGASGAQGQAGTNGAAVLNGTSAPTSSVGTDGDFYLDTTSEVLYGPKAAGTWPATGISLVGPPGTNGTNGTAILNGTSAPTASVGTDGDFYLDTTSEVLYGPKAAGAWPAAGISLVGPAGAPPTPDLQQVATLAWWGANYSSSSYGFNAPSAIAFDGTHLWVTNAGNNSVTEIAAR